MLISPNPVVTNLKPGSPLTVGGTIDSSFAQGGIQSVTVNFVLAGMTVPAAAGTFDPPTDTWSATLPAILGDGAHDGTYDVQVTAFNNQLFSGSDNTTGELIVDTKAPIVSIDPNTIKPTSNTSPTLSGTVVDPAPSSGLNPTNITVRIDSQSYLANLEPDGKTWRLTVPVSLTEGSHDITVFASDIAQNVGSSGTTQLFVDKTSPTVIVDKLPVTDQVKPTLTGTVIDGALSSGIYSLTVYVDTQSLTVQPLSLVPVQGQPGTWSWSVAVPTALPQGPYQVYDVSATVVDNAGNQGSSTTIGALTIDTTPPTVTIVGQISASSTPILTGTAFDTTPLGSGVPDNTMATILLTDAQGVQQTLVAPVVAGAWTLDLSQKQPDNTYPQPLADGPCQVKVTVPDLAGNVGVANPIYPLTVDTVYPTVSVDKLFKNNNALTLTGTVSDASPSSGIGVTVTVLGTSLTNLLATLTPIPGAPNTWTWSVPASLDYGTYDVQATATDGAGNSTPATNKLLVASDPVVTVDTLPPTMNNKPTLTGTFSSVFAASGIASMKVEFILLQPGQPDVLVQTLTWPGLPNITVNATSWKRRGLNRAGRRNLQR